MKYELSSMINEILEKSHKISFSRSVDDLICLLLSLHHKSSLTLSRPQPRLITGKFTQTFFPQLNFPSLSCSPRMSSGFVSVKKIFFRLRNRTSSTVSSARECCRRKSKQNNFQLSSLIRQIFLFSSTPSQLPPTMKIIRNYMKAAAPRQFGKCDAT